MTYLILGDQSLILKSTLNQIIQAAIDHVDDFNYASFDFENNPLEEIIDCLETPAFLSDKKVVVIKRPYFFVDDKKKLPFKNDLSLLTNYLEHPSDNIELIIVCDSNYYKPKSKYFNMIKKYVTIKNLFFESNDELADYANTLIKKLNIQISREAFDILLMRCQNVESLEKEITKLSLFGNYVDADVATRLIPQPLEDNIFELSNALLRKDNAKAMKIYTDLKLMKTDTLVLINLLASQFRVILQVGILKNEHMSNDEIATTLNIHPYRVKLAAENTRKYSLNQVKKFLITLSNLDIDIKRGVKDRYIDFEIFLATANSL